MIGKMQKVAVFTILTVAFILLCWSHNVKPDNRKNNHGRRLHRRLCLDVPPPIFDPIVVKLEEKGSSKTVLEEGKEYFHDDGKLNVNLRLMVLFPLLDRNPKDGFVDFKELEEWIMQQAIDRMHHRTKRELESRDGDGDGAISFKEYLPQFTDEDIERNNTSHGEAGWWMEQFKNADGDRNGTLNLYEFRDFLHPEDSRNEHIQRWLLRDKIRQIDSDNDKKLNMMEFKKAYDSYKTYLEFEGGEGEYPTLQDLFTKLDMDKDGFLQVDELRPIIQYLNPGELTSAKYYSSFLLHQADDNGDEKLTLDEMLNYGYIFYNSLYDNGKYDDDTNDGYHDEF